MYQLFDEFKEVIITAIISGASAVFAFFAGKKRQVAETRQVEADVVRSIQELYGGLVEDLKLTSEESRRTREELIDTRKNMVALDNEVSQLRKDIASMESELEECRKQLK